MANVFESCPRCDKLLWVAENEICRCKPHEYRFERDDIDDWQTAYGISLEDLAESLVERDWSQDPCDPHKVDEVVIFRDIQDNEVRYHVCAEARAVFTAKEVENG